MAVSSQELFDRYKDCVGCVFVLDNKGDEHTGAAFYIGDGYFATARHVVDEKQSITLSSPTQMLTNTGSTPKRILLPSTAHADVAIIEGQPESIPIRHVWVGDNVKQLKEIVGGAVPLGGETVDWLDPKLMLSKAVAFGYPPIPVTTTTGLVVVTTEVNALVTKYNAPHQHFVVSMIPRKGFSGGPLISEYGYLLGIIIEGLQEQDQAPETGFAVAVSVDPLLDLLWEHGIKLSGENGDLLEQLSNPGFYESEGVGFGSASGKAELVIALS